MVLGPYSTARALDFADAAFSNQWQGPDKPVQDGSSRRSWVWGLFVSEGRNEPYADSPGGQRLVQYFDKARMEINNPNTARSDRFFVTNGLLVTEMISGQLQTGDKTFGPNPVGPSQVQVAGDPDNGAALTYASFGPVASLEGNNRIPNQSGQPAINTLSKDGTAGQNPGTANYGVVNAYYSEDLGHNIPNVFWDFLNQRGPIYQNGGLTNGLLFDWVSAVGLPLTEAYWSRAVVAGTEKDVLVQMFQRRVLTYTPSNEAAFRVEMGNVGQHYFKWRYNSPPPPTPTPAPPVSTPLPPVAPPAPASIPAGPANWSAPYKMPQPVARPIVRVRPTNGDVWVLGENKGTAGIYASVLNGPTLNLKPGSGGEKVEASFDNAGNLHVVWQEGTQYGMQTFYARINPDGKQAWLRDLTQELTGKGSSSGNPSIYANPAGGSVYLAHEENPQTLVVYESNDQGQTWINRKVVAANNQAQLSPRLVADTAGNIVVVWTRNPGCGYYDMYAATRINGNWSNPFNLTNFNCGWNIYVPGISLAPNNDVYVNWISPGNPGTAIGVRRWNAQTQSWEARHDIISNSAGSDRIRSNTITVSSNGTIWSAFCRGTDNTGGAFVSTSTDNGNTWSPVQNIFNNVQPDVCSVTSVGGNVYYVATFSRQTYFTYRSQ